MCNDVHYEMLAVENEMLTLSLLCLQVHSNEFCYIIAYGEISFACTLRMLDKYRHYELRP